MFCLEKVEYTEKLYIHELMIKIRKEKLSFILKNYFIENLIIPLIFMNEWSKSIKFSQKKHFYWKSCIESSKVWNYCIISGSFLPLKYITAMNNKYCDVTFYTVLTWLYYVIPSTIFPNRKLAALNKHLCKTCPVQLLN